MSSFLSAASIDIVLGCLAIAHLLLSAFLLRKTSRRDKGFSERFEKWRHKLERASRERRSRPFPAE